MNQSLSSRGIGMAAAACVMSIGASLANASVTLPIAVYNNAGGASLSGLNVTVNISDGGSFALFSIQNNSSGLNAAAVVTGIYFESTAFSSAFLGAGVLDAPFMTGVNYSPGATPGNPAGGMSPSWGGNKFTAGPASPPTANGVNSGEEVGVRFAYLGGMDFATLTTALVTDPSLFRVAMHIQSVGFDAQSVWGITVPAPGALALLGAAGGLSLRRRRA
ncbi:MAG: PEP-CTERM sorting domain-containing protein [Phycisphaeraceae bacterium]|nr:PEP-CTERM sorting domain-containing protein [Phycisphaeraceae bacterium]